LRQAHRREVQPPADQRRTTPGDLQLTLVPAAANSENPAAVAALISP